MEFLIFICWACIFHIIAHLALLFSPALFSRQTKGTILRIEPFGEKSFLLTVNYPAEDGYFRRWYVSKCDIDHLSVGDRITIAYRPKHPKLSAVQGLGDQPVVAELGFWAGRLCLGVALMALVMFPWPIVG